MLQPQVRSQRGHQHRNRTCNEKENPEVRGEEEEEGGADHDMGCRSLKHLFVCLSPERFWVRCLRGTALSCPESTSSWTSPTRRCPSTSRPTALEDTTSKSKVQTSTWRSRRAQCHSSALVCVTAPPAEYFPAHTSKMLPVPPTRQDTLSVL